jgi:hypothetical protein
MSSSPLLRRNAWSPCGAALALAICLLFALACGGAAPVDEDTDAPCCSVDDVVRLHREGVGDELILATLRTSATDVELSADDIVTLNDAGVSAEVIDVLNGGPCLCEELPEPEPAASGGPEPDDGPARLRLAVNWNGGRNMEVVNLGTADYTNVTMVINDEYQYRLKKLKGNAGDFVRFKSFVSRRTGAEAKGKIDMKKIVITADQGIYSRTW